jgi:Fic family protein
MARLWRDYGAIVIYCSYMYSPRFTITPQMNTQIAEIERLREVVGRSRILPTKEVVLRKRASIEATRSSTGIEGNPLSVHEVELVLSGQKIIASERFITEVINYKKSLELIEKRAKNDTPLSVKDILSVHAAVMKNLLPKTKIGAFRKTPVYVVDLVGGKEIVRYQGPKPEAVPSLVEELLEWLLHDKGHLHPLLIAGILHYEFVSIHPFADGNGRVTRLLTLLYLYRSRFAFRNVLVPDSYYFKDRQKYYESLNRARKYGDQRKADLTPWLAYFIEGLHEAVKNISQKITAVSLPEGNREVITLTQEDYQIIDFISTFGNTSVDEIVSAVKISKRTVQRRLLRLVKTGLLIRIGKGPSTEYQLNKT